MVYRLRIGIVCVVLVVGCSWLKLSRVTEQQTQEIATPIITALNIFYQNQSTYPQQIEELVPLYLAVLPQDTLGQDFDYRKETEGYSLCFWGYPQTPNDGCCYISRFDLWDCTDGH